MANLYLSDALGSLKETFFGDPVTQANQVTADKLDQALNFAFGQHPSGIEGNLEVSAGGTKVTYILAQGAEMPAPVKIEITGTGFPAGATTLEQINSLSTYTITQYKVTVDDISTNLSGTSFATPISVVTLDTNIAVSATRMTSFAMTGFDVKAGDVEVKLTGALNTSLLANGDVASATFDNAALSITYDTNPSPTTTSLAQIYLKGNFAFANSGTGDDLSSALITEFGLKTFPGTDLGATPTHYFYGDNLDISLADLKLEDSATMTQADVMRQIFNGANDTVYASANAVIPEGFEKVVIQGVGAVQIEANGLNNFITGNAGNNIIDGGAGTDTFITGGTLAGTTGHLNADGSITLTSTAAGVDTLLPTYTSKIIGSLPSGTLFMNGATTGGGGDDYISNVNNSNFAPMTFAGGDGNDFLVYRGGYSTTFSGGSGYDTLVVNNGASISGVWYEPTGGYSGTINGWGGSGSMSFDGVEALLLSNGATYAAGGSGLDIYYGNFSESDYQAFLQTGYAFEGYELNLPSVSLVQGASVENIQFGASSLAMPVMDVVDGMSETSTHRFDSGVNGNFTITNPQTGDGVFDGQVFASSAAAASSSSLQTLVLNSGKIMVLTSQDSGSGFQLQRLNQDGSPDVTFGMDGTYSVPSGSTWGAKMVEMPNGNIAVLTSSSLYKIYEGSYTPPIAGGVATTSVTHEYVNMNGGGFSYSDVDGIFATGGGKLLMVGSSYQGSYGPSNGADLFSAIVDLPSGSAGGTSVTPIVHRYEIPNNQDVLASAFKGGVAYALSYTNSNQFDSGSFNGEIYKIDASTGVFDPTWKITTSYVRPHGDQFQTDPLGMTVDGNGNILVAYYNKFVGYGSSDQYTEIEVARYTPSGTLDASFGGDGKVQYKFENDDWSDAYGSNNNAKNLLSVDSANNPILAFGRDGEVEVLKISSNGSTIDILTHETTLSGTDSTIDAVDSAGSDRPISINVASNGSMLLTSWGDSGLNDSGFGVKNYGHYSIAKLTATGDFDLTFDDTHEDSYVLSAYGGGSVPSWLTLDTSGANPKIVVSNAPDAEWGHHYMVLTASGSNSVSQVFDVFIKPSDMGTNDTFVFDKTMVASKLVNGVITPLDETGNPSPLGLDTLDLSQSQGLIGTKSEVVVDATTGIIEYWANGAASGDASASYQIAGFERYVLGASTGYFIGTDDTSEYVVLKSGTSNYEVFFGSDQTGAAETDIISFEGGASAVTIALSNSDDPNALVVANLGSVTHRIHGAEGVIGSEATDTITGNYRDNILVGNGGSDTITGGDGNDILVGGAGAGDKLYGGTGSDWLIDLDGGELQGNATQLTSTDRTNAQRDIFVVNSGAKIQNFQLSESGTGLAGRAQNANDAIVFNLNLGTIAGLSQVQTWSWVTNANYSAASSAQREAFNATVRQHVKFDAPVEVAGAVAGQTDIRLDLWMYENTDFTGAKVLVGSTVVSNVQKAAGDQLTIVSLNNTGYQAPDAAIDDDSFPSLFKEEIFGETTSVNLAIALESVKAGTIRQLPNQTVMSAKWDGTEHFYNPAEGNQKIIATNANDTVELLVQEIPNGSAGSDKVYDIGGTDTLSFSDAHIADLHFDAVRIGREVGNQSLQVSYSQGDGTIINAGDLTWTGHFRSGVDMALDQVIVKDVDAHNGVPATYKTYQMADTVYNWDHGVLRGIDLVAKNGDDTIMVGQDNADKADKFVIEEGFTKNSTVEIQDVFIWGFDSNAAANRPNTLDKIDLSDFGLLDSGAIHTDLANKTVKVDIANTSGNADQLVIHLMDTTNLNSLDDILLYQHA